MRNTISNDQITFISDSFNVEPWVLKYNDDDVNYFWRPVDVEKLGTAVCFPLLGVVPDNKYILDGKEYSMAGHGFAQKFDFQVAELTKTSVVYEINETPETLKQYPFKFRFQVAYTVEGNTLKTEYRVRNTDTKEIFFSVGGHPRYSCPMEAGKVNFEDYYAVFEKPANKKDIVKSYGPVEVIEKYLSADGKKLSLNYEMFTEGCFCLHPVTETLYLKSEKSTRGLKLYMPGVSHFQFWTSVGGKFIALEPWYGSITSIPPRPEDSNWKERKGTLRLSPGKDYAAAYHVSILR